MTINPLYQVPNNEIVEGGQVIEQKPMIRIKPISKGQALVIDDWDIAFGNSTYQVTVAQLKLTISPDAAAGSFSLPITSDFSSKQGDIFGLKMHFSRPRPPSRNAARLPGPKAGQLHALPAGGRLSPDFGTGQFGSKLLQAEIHPKFGLTRG